MGGDGGSWAERQKGGESAEIRQEAARGPLCSLIELHRDKTFPNQLSQRERCDLLPLCHVQHTGAGLAKAPSAVASHRPSPCVLHRTAEDLLCSLGGSNSREAGGL